MPALPSTLSLGALHRLLCEDARVRGRSRVAIHFEQRSATSVESAQGRDPELLAMRRFSAVVDSVDGALLRANLSTGGKSATPSASIMLVRSRGTFLYSRDGVRFGVLEHDPDLFDISQFQAQLDAINVEDATVEQTSAEERGILVLDIDVTVPAFRALLAAFAGEPHGEDLDLRSYSLVLSAAASVTLDYWWSLVAVEEVADGGQAYRHDIACHVDITVSPLEDAAAAEPVEVDPDLPPLAYLDDVWGLTRRPAGAAVDQGGG